MRRAIKTLREIETNRVVKIWEPADWQLYQQALALMPDADRRTGVMPGSLWGESGFVYCSVVPEDVPI